MDLTRYVGFDWDAGNARKSVDKHAVSQPEAEQVFFNQPLLMLPNPRHSQKEPRFHALGQSDTGRWLHITFTERPRAKPILIRVISARDMHRKERKVYEQAENDSRIQE
jgi:uncharacterized DUF497 family protein